MQKVLPYRITSSLAENTWNKNKDFYNTFDVILTTDTVSLSYIFLRHLSDLKPHLIILNCNRFNYDMENEHEFLSLLQSASKKLDKMTYLPYTDFERVWCGIHGVFLHERAIMPVGDYKEHIKDPQDTIERFAGLDTKWRTRSQSETIFLQNYHNHHRFMNLSEYLHDRNVSVDYGSYMDINDLKAYKAIVVLPDQFSKYFTFESVQKELVVILPSQRFLMDLVTRNGYYFNVEGSSGRLTSNYVNMCEWYKYPESRIYFDSFDEMIDIINNLDETKLEKIKEWCRFYGKVIREEHTLQWKHILDKIMIKTAV